MPKGSQELTNARRQEIIDVCAALYETHSFKEISILEISRATSFTRTSIYNYFQTKEEIFLALLEQEYARWCDDMTHLPDGPQTVDAFAAALAWQWARGVASPIVGATKARYLDDATGALDVPLTAEDIAALEECYVPHPIVGAINANPPLGVMLLDEKK